MLVNKFLFLRIICCWFIIWCGLVPKTLSWFVLTQGFIMWVHEFVLCMDRMIWNDWIQWVNGPHLWLWQFELLFWIQTWIKHPIIIGRNNSTWTWLGHNFHSQVTQWLTYCRVWNVLKWSDLVFPDKSPGARHIVMTWCIFLFSYFYILSLMVT